MHYSIYPLAILGESLSVKNETVVNGLSFDKQFDLGTKFSLDSKTQTIQDNTPNSSGLFNDTEHEFDRIKDQSAQK